MFARLSEYPRMTEFVNPASPVSDSGVLQAARESIHENGVLVEIDHVLELAEHPSHALRGQPELEHRELHPLTVSLANLGHSSEP